MASKKRSLVGDGKPPKHSQFKKGTSRNKKGRPKGIKNLATLFHKASNIDFGGIGHPHRVCLAGWSKSRNYCYAGSVGARQPVSTAMLFSRRTKLPLVSSSSDIHRSVLNLEAGAKLSGREMLSHFGHHCHRIYYAI
jgi:hypothetical protein